MNSRKMLMSMNTSHLMKIELRKMGLIILTMPPPVIIRVITQVTMTVLTHTFHPHPMMMIITQDTITQHKSNT